MSSKKFILAVVVSFILSNSLTTLWYLFTDAANMVSFRKAEMNYVGLIMNHLIYALLFVVLFVPFFEQNPKLSRGFIFGLLAGAIMFVPSGIVVRSIWTVDFNGIFVLNSIAHIFIGGLMGVASAIIYNWKKA